MRNLRVPSSLLVRPTSWTAVSGPTDCLHIEQPGEGVATMASAPEVPGRRKRMRTPQHMVSACLCYQCTCSGRLHAVGRRAVACVRVSSRGLD